MAPGRGHVDVSERRLRPIYDCLDNGNNKKAIQEADKVLRKQKDFQCAKVLKALALLRLGRHDESVLLLDEVHAQHPSDEATLQAMSIGYRELNKVDLIADLYANAHKAKPNNEEILSALFMAYVRLSDYKKQQQTAVALHKLKPKKNPYYFWAVMSIIMQAHTDPKLAKMMFLPLAEKMVKKYVDDDKIEAEAEVQLYLIILDQIGKYEDALNVLSGKLGDKLMSELFFKKEMTAELLAKLERWSDVNSAYRKLLLDDPDHWYYYSQYFKSFVHLHKSGWSPPENTEDKIDNTVDLVLAFLEYQVTDTVKSERMIRGPYLAKLEFIKLLHGEGIEGAEKLGSPMSLIEEYYAKFGSKPSCMIDLDPYVNLLKEGELEKFVNEKLLSDGWKNEEIKYADSPKEIQQHFTLLQLQRCVGAHTKLSAESKENLAKELVQRYRHGLKFGCNLLPSDLQYSDQYLHMAVHLLYDLYQETGSQNYIWQAIMLLEDGIKSSPANYQFKFLLLKFYPTVGALGPCLQIYESMEVKHVQHDAISYILSNQITRLGHFSSAQPFFESICRFFTYNYKDSTEYLIQAYKYGSFNKIGELVDFRERLKHSLQYASASVERMMINLLVEPSSHQTTEQVVGYFEIDPEKDVYELLRDNRDTGVMSSWEPAHLRLTNELKNQSFKEEEMWLQIRHHTLRCITIAMEMSKQSVSSDENDATTNGNNKCNNTNVLQGLIAKFSGLITKYRMDLPKAGQYPLAGPSATCLQTYLDMDLSKLFLDSLESVVYIQTFIENGTDKCDPTSYAQISSNLHKTLHRLIMEKKKSYLEGEGKDVHFNVDALETTFLLTEALALLTVLAGVCWRLLTPLKSGKKGKKGKKNPEAQTNAEGPMATVIENVRNLISGLEECGKELQTGLKDLDTGSITASLSQLHIHHVQQGQVPGELSGEIWEKINASYQQSAKELSLFVSNKLTYLQSLTA